MCFFDDLIKNHKEGAAIKQKWPTRVDEKLCADLSLKLTYKTISITVSMVRE